MVYTTYTLDRALECEEDKINKRTVRGVRKDLSLSFCLISFLTGTFILSREGLQLVAFIPIVVGYVYSNGVKTGDVKLKVKGGFGIKNLVVALTWSAFITGIISRWTDSMASLFSVFSFFFTKLFITSTVNDFQDVKGDMAAGIKPLPIWLRDMNILTLSLGQINHPITTLKAHPVAVGGAALYRLLRPLSGSFDVAGENPCHYACQGET